MTQLEKLAREICWAGFNTKSRKMLGSTKAGYWKDLPPESRSAYEADARQFVWVLRAIPIDVLNLAHELGYPHDLPKG